MADEKNHSEGYKVVDRRLFGEDGKLRDARNDERGQTAPVIGSPASAPAKQTPKAAPEPVRAREARPEPAPSYEAADADFEMLVSYLSTTAMFQLGLLPGPGGERIAPDLANARRTIDLLGVLAEKTQGNLTPAEAQLLDDVMADLRMGFVEMESRLAKKPR